MKHLILLILAVVLLGSGANTANGQNKNTQSGKKTAIFQVPDGFMPAKMPPDKIGLSILNPKAPAGMFLAYTPDDQKSADFIIKLRKMYAGFFEGLKDEDFTWKESTLPAQEGVTETGKMFMGSGKDKEVQIAVFIRTISEGQDIVYGYFAMRDLKSKNNSAELLDEKGKGVKEFEKFRKTIGVQK